MSWLELFIGSAIVLAALAPYLKDM